MDWLLVVWIILVSFLFGVIVGVLSGYYRLANHLKNNPYSKWWKVIKGG